MKIPPDAVIAWEKLTHYLLVFKEIDDKSKFLAQGGFTLDNPESLVAAIWALNEAEDAMLERMNEYGNFYQVTGNLIGLNERELWVTTVWLEDKKLGNFKFITLKPRKKLQDED